MTTTKPFVTKDSYLQSVYDAYKQGLPVQTDEIIDHFVQKNIGKPSKVGQLSAFKTHLKNIRESPEVSKLYMIPEIRDETNKIREDSFNNRETIQIKRSLVKKLLKLLKHEDYAQIYVGLLLASGRRISEIIHLDLIKNDKNSILFKGQLKTKNPEAYVVPLLVSFNAFKTAFERARELSKGVTEKKVQQKIRDALLFESKNKQLTVHSLRAVYATEMYQRSDKTQLRSNFIKRLLGHSDNTSSVNYDKVNFI